MNNGRKRKGLCILGSFIDALDHEICIKRITAWGLAKESRAVSICNVHVLVTAAADGLLQAAINNSDLATPDGMPIAWTLRLNGFPSAQRISGPDLMLDVLAQLNSENLPVFFYGSTPGTLAKLTRRMRNRFPNLKIAGAHAPPFRPLSSAEDAQVTAQINASGAGILFVGLGCPKQELWIANHLGKIDAVMIGVGAAFDFHAGNVARAPLFLQKVGLEWLYRLYREPRRLFHRYFTTNLLFIKYVLQRKLVVAKGDDGFQSKV